MSKKRLLIIALCLCTVLSLVLPAAAWFHKAVDIQYPQLSAYTDVAYFESGNGSAESPYIISNPVHLYNLAWLQYIGYFNLGDVNNGRAQSYFKLKNDINMNGLALPPIGTTEYPFIGNFDGNGKVISNLVTGNAKSLLTKRPEAAQFQNVNNLLTDYNISSTNEAGAVIGFFGVVGDYNGAIAALDTQQALYPAFSEDAIGLTNTGLSNYTLTDSSSSTTAGFIAGYVNAAISGMQVNGTLSVVNAAGKLSDDVSEYGLVGYCTDAYIDTLSSTVITVTDPLKTLLEKFPMQNSSGGSGQGWGGSIAMDTLYDTVASVYPATVTPVADYVYYEQRTLSATGESQLLDSQSSDTAFIYSTQKNDQFSVVFTRYSENDDSTDYYYLSGGKKVYLSASYAYGQEVTAYTVSREGNYLAVDSTPDLANTTDSGAAATWILDSSGYLYTDVNGIAYYLNAVNHSSVTLSAEGSTQWEMTEEGLQYTSGNTTYYLVCNDGVWSIGSEGSTKYRIYTTSGNTSYYLSSSGTSLSAPTDEDSATLWNVSNGTSGTISTVINGTTYYVYCGGNSLSLSTTSTSWSNSNNILSCTVQSSSGWGGNQNRTYYLRYNNNAWSVTTGGGGWGGNTSGSTLTFEAVEIPLTGNDLSIASTTARELIGSTLTEDEGLTMEFTVENSTYIPLQLNGDTFAPEPSNTGYITSGTWDETSSQGYPLRSGDIRVSQYAESNISNYSTQLYICTDGNFQTISLTASGGDYGLEKFDDCKADYETMFTDDDNYLYGLHFMSGLISKDVLVTIPSATVNGETYENYKVPADCIDFNLKERGRINFFAGTYFSGNDCFFSLHKITRSGTEITDIREIEMIYGTDSQRDRYIYEYADGSLAYSDDTAVSELPEGYSMVFDMTWLKNPTGITNNRGYYFEIPVDEGEYALGSVDGGTGAYLLYLDISANAQLVERTMYTEVITQTTDLYHYTSGVQVMEGSSYNTETDDAELLALTLPANTQDAYTISKSDDVVTVTSDNTGWQVSAAEGVTVVNAQGEAVTPVPDSQTVLITKRVTFVDENVNTGEITKLIITREEQADGSVVITALNQDGEDVTSTVVGSTSADQVTALNTSKADDQIAWNEISGSTTVLQYRYVQYNPSNTDSVTNSSVYDPDSVSYTVTVTCTGVSITLQIETVSYTENVTSITLNGVTPDVSTPIQVDP